MQRLFSKMKTILFLGQKSGVHIIFLVLLSFVVKGWYIGVTSLGGDECFSVFASQLPVSEIVSWLSTGNNPPLWELLLHFWTQLFGTSEVAVRVPALIFNCLTVIPIYAIGAKFFSKKAGFFSALLFIFSSFSLFMAHEARVYSLATFLAATSAYLFLTLPDAHKSKKRWISLTMVNVLLLYSHYLTAWIILLQTLIFLIDPITRKTLRWNYVFHLSVVILLFAPFLFVFLNRFLDAGSHGTWVSTIQSYKEFYYMLWHYSNNPYLTRVLIPLIFVGLIFLFWKRQQVRQNFRPALLIHLLFWVPFTISFLASYKIGFFLDRYMFLFTPFYYLSIVLSIHHIFYKSNRMATIISSMVVVFMIGSFTMDSTSLRYSNYHQNTKTVAAEIQKEQGLKTIILLCPKWYDKEVMYYLDREVFNSYRDTYKEEVAFRKPLTEKGIYAISHIDEFPQGFNFERIVYVNHQCEFHCPENNILLTLEQQYKKVDAKKIAECDFYIFEKR